MQLRRVLLLFALVLGLSALVASIVPPPDTRQERDDAPPGRATTGAQPSEPLSFTVPADPRGQPPPTHRVASGSSLALEVSVPEPGDVALEGLGLRASAEPLAPARFDLVARPIGRYAVVFTRFGGRPRIAGRLIFAEAAGVRRPARRR